MTDFSNVETVKSLLEIAQGNQQDEREQARECTTFLSKRDGQWDDYTSEKMANRPRFTFDRTTPMIDLIVGELEQNEFAARVSAAQGQASKDTAEVYDGLIRNIQNWSNAQQKYKKVARKLAENGIDHLRVVQDWVNDDSFEQDLKIEYIPNSIDRVWFDPNSEEQDHCDAMWCVVLQALTKEAYEEKFPEGSGESLSDDNNDYNYDYKREVITVGELLYKKEEERELLQLKNGQVLEDNEENKKILDELAAIGVTVVNRRKRKVCTVYSHKFDAGGWLEEEKKTAFRLIPVIPFYHGHQIVENKLVWRRIVEKLMDPQRVFNFAVSRQIEEAALAPRRKIMMTREQAKGHEAKLKTLNTNADPVQFYNPDPKAPQPYETGGPQVNPALSTISMESASNIEAVAGMYSANLGKNPGVQSGVALELQQNKGDTGNSSFYADMAVGITYLCKVLVDTIPRVYDTTREIALLNEDGTREVVEINKTIVDEQTGQPVKVNFLNEGVYDVVCSMGPMFKNRLQQGNSAMLEAAKAIPSVMEEGADIFLRNIQAPNMDALADRVRSKMFQAGMIPPEQMTEQEQQILMQQQALAAQQGQQLDPMQMQAMATLQAQEAESVAKAQESAVKAQNDQLTAQAKMMEQINKGREQDRKDMQAQQDMIKTMAETLNIIREAMGVDTITGPHNTGAYVNQSQQLQQAIPGEAQQIVNRENLSFDQSQ